MRLTDQLGIIFAFVLYTHGVNAQQAGTAAFPRVSIPETEVRHIQSSIVGDEFEISIALPSNYYSTDTTYPVLYITDANLFFAATTQIVRMMQLGNELPQMLIVGIGYRSDSLSNWLALRSRDLTPTPTPDPNGQGWLTGGAPLFLRFIREELIPFITKNYRTSPDATYAGISYGGLFGLYVLFHEPTTFHTYLIGSPSIWFDNRVILKYEADYAKINRDLSAKVFMSVGELEERQSSAAKMVTNMKQLADTLMSRKYPGLNLETKIFEGETHVSAPAVETSRGLRSIYRK